MKKIVIQGLLIVVLFFSSWFVLTQIDWMTVFNVREVTNKTEEKLGNLFLEIYTKTEKENKTPFVINSIDSLVNKICLKNGIDRNTIKVHIIEKDEINAFALPHGHLIIYDALILASNNQEELCGVICHEMAHIQLHHVMKKLIKEVGLSVLLSMTSTNGGTEIIKETAKMLSSSAFDRSLEREADIKAVEYLIQANVNPEPFANFLFQLSQDEHEAMKYFAWASTHPDSEERAKYVLELCKNSTVEYEPILSEDNWRKLKDNLME